jgi:signal peptidase I
MGASKIRRGMKKIGRTCLRFLSHETVRGILEFLLILGTAYFFLAGALILVFRTDSYWMAVESPSMSHADEETWRKYFEDKLTRGRFFQTYKIPIQPEDIRVFDTSKFPIEGGFEEGDLLVIQGVYSVSDISVGDVLIMDRGSGVIPLTHRVLAMWEEEGKVKIATKGDANDYLLHENGDIFYSEDVIGKVIFVVPKLGHISLWFREVIG